MINYFVDVSDSYVSTSSQNSISFFGGLESKLDLSPYETNSYKSIEPAQNVVNYGVQDIKPYEGAGQVQMGMLTAQWSSSYFINNLK